MGEVWRRYGDESTASPPALLDHDRFEAIRGAEWYINGMVTFPHQELDEPGMGNNTFYKTVFGPYYPSRRIMQANTVNNLKLASTRFTAIRESKAREAQYFADQTTFVASHHWLYLKVKEHAEKHFTDWEGTIPTVCKRKLEPHNKKIARIHAHADIMEMGSELDTVWHSRGKDYPMKASLKLQESLEPDKMGRIVVDLGVAASLQTAFIYDKLKKALTEDIVTETGRYRFVAKPTMDQLQSTIDMLIDPDRDYFIAYFSDDAIMSIRLPNGEVRWFLLDISKCDSSHRNPMFEALHMCVPDIAKAASEVAIAQCQQDFMFVNPECKKQQVVLRSKIGKRMPSGWGGTTVTNDIASLSAAVCVAESKAQTCPEIAAATARAGYKYTISRAMKEEEIQFLKHSPARDIHGKWRPVLNFGVFLGASGVCKRDLPGRGDIGPRAKAFMKGLLNGMYPHTHTPFLDTLRSKFADAHIDVKMQRFIDRNKRYMATISTTDHYFTDRAFFARYSLEESEYLELIDLLNRSDLGTMHQSTGLDKIWALDYGTCGPTHD
jgi:hypothetical protein